MKNLLTILLLSVSFSLFADGPTLKSFNSQKIDLKLSMYKDKPDNRKLNSNIVMIAGLSFITASILEGNYNYGTWSKTPTSSSPYNQTYTTKPFIQQLPRSIMCFTGVALTLTGGIIRLSIK